MGAALPVEKVWAICFPFRLYGGKEGNGFPRLPEPMGFCPADKSHVAALPAFSFPERKRRSGRKRGREARPIWHILPGVCPGGFDSNERGEISMEEHGSVNSRYDYWHPEKRFGLFIHWGIYALTEWHEQAQMRARIPREEYERLPERFRPSHFDPEAWVLAAKDAGMRYLCFTTKHHDGFCMWDTHQTDYKVTNTPYGRDVLKELSLACEKHGMALCLYYSIPDWHHPNAYNPKSTHQIPPRPSDVPDMARYIAYVKAQVKELLTGYGKIWGFFWDIPPQIHDPSVNELVRGLQPGIMINDRGFDQGDFSTPERFVPEGKAFRRPTEACQSLGRQAWGYRADEDYYSMGTLTSSIDRIMAMGGNYLLNVGPMPDGRFPPEAQALLRAVGGWYHRVREAFEGAAPASGLMPGREDFLLTRKGKDFYFHFPQGLESSGLLLNPIGTLPREAVILNNGARPLRALDEMPTLHDILGGPRPFLHLSQLSPDRLAGEAVVLRLTFDHPEEVELACAGLDASRESRF